ncbi:MAG: polyprenyl synthetase family protein [Proteobacteria bacterium]|nr:polyprenyl synthetase family protein [Desulfobulbaceae bacterium]MBU4152937.1 polyprenyl synthetase family protein [Pseudomonadota bacterium]
MDIKAYLSAKREQVEQVLYALMPAPGNELNHHIESLNYSLQAGGKRVRPILCLAAAESLGHDVPSQLMIIPCALECIHTYSLIHDDLPAMDDDALRRGKPTNHMIYGEAGAILAGDGLLTFAFELLSKPEASELVSDRDRLRITHLIAKAIGSYGMVGGQALDMEAEDRDIPLAALQMIHQCKTGALITASVQTGAILGQANSTQYQALTSYGELVGLAFQIVDDLLNVEGTTEQLGKASGSDAKKCKATYPAFLGVEQTRIKAQETIQTAIDTLAEFGPAADPLRELARYIYRRTN